MPQMMHSVDGIGFERVFNFVSKLAPGFKKAVILHMKDDRATDFKNLEEILIIYQVLDYLPVPKRDVSISTSLGLNPLNRQINVSLRLRDISRTFIR